MKVSWQVTGIRSDSWAKAHPVMVEEEKPEDEKGYYQNPELYNQAPENSTLWRGNSELRRRLEEPRQDASRLDIDQVREQVRTLTEKVRKHRTQPPAGGE